MKITAIHLDDSAFKDYQITGTRIKTLDGLSRLNICIGENNSGKSRFIRQLLNNRTSKYDFDLDIIKNINSIENTSPNSINWDFSDVNDFNYTLNELQINYRKSGESKNDYTTINVDKLSRITDILSTTINQYNKILFREKNKHELIVIQKIKSYQNFIIEGDPFELKINQIYIPILRGYKSALNEISTNLKADVIDAENKNFTYKRIIRQQYFDSDSIYFKIETNEDLYLALLKNLLGDKQMRDNIRYFESFISETFFNGTSFTITPVLNDDTTKNQIIKVLIGENANNEQYIYNLGDGIASIIDILLPIFMKRNEINYIFIEEPEINLHPGMQRILIEALLNEEYFPNSQYFITTHSNHFLDLAFEYPEDISIFHFQKKVEADKEYFEINPTKSTDLDILNSLGVRNSSVFLSNCTIWVEGITDRLYLKKYLELYQKTKDQIFHEDLHYSFLEYAGSNIVHWDFENEESKEDMINALKVSNKIFLIMDNDEAEGSKKKSKQKLHKRLKKELNNNFYKLKVKEIENLLKVDVVTAALENINKKGQTVSLKTGVSPSSVYTGIGSFIHENYNGLSRAYCDTTKENQTISSKYKTEFCKAACKVMNSYEELSQEAKKLTERVYKFIEEHNRK